MQLGLVFLFSGKAPLVERVEVWGRYQRLGSIIVVEVTNLIPTYMGLDASYIAAEFADRLSKYSRSGYV